VSNASHRRTKRVRFAPIAIGSGALAAVLLSLSLTGTLSAFTAQITNSTNTASAGTLSMQETGSGTVGGATITCNSTDPAGGTIYGAQTATCAGINKFGGSTLMIPGQTVTQSISIKNTGTVTPATFKLTPGATCTATGTGTNSATTTQVCAAYNVVITDTTVSQVVYTGTVGGLAGAAPISINTPPAGNTSHTFTFAVTLASTADNTYQGTGVSLPLVWTFSA
jgi:hypothetical protein